MCTRLDFLRPSQRFSGHVILSPAPALGMGTHTRKWYICAAESLKVRVVASQLNG